MLGRIASSWKWVFLIILGVLTMFITDIDIYEFSLQHILVESIVEKRVVYVEDPISPHPQIVTDVFEYNGHTYAIKQPGQAFVGAIFYFFLSKVGITYYSNHELVASLVTMLTSTVSVAMVAVLVGYIVNAISKDRKFASIVAALTVFGTVLFPYSGVLHHDTIATLSVFLAIFALYRYLYEVKSYRLNWIFIAGIFSGLTFFFSFLPLGIVLAIAISVLLRKRIHEIGVYLFGAGVGILPSFLYNFFALGGLTHFPNLMGGAQDTVPVMSLSLMYQNLSTYLLTPGLSIFLFSPIAVVGLVGYRYFPKKYIQLKKMLLLGVVISALHLLTLQTYGGSQYGPRYLMSLMPTAMLGMSGYRALKKKQFRKIWRTLIIPLGLLSIVAFYPGGAKGAMYHTLDRHPLIEQLARMMGGYIPDYPIRILGIVMVVGTLLIVSRSGKKS